MTTAKTDVDSKSADFSIIIPVFNSETSLEELCARIDQVFKEYKGKYEVILVDDCSVDNSWQVMNSLREKNSRIKIIQLMRNYGQHNALLCGILAAQYETIVTMDDDLQHPPEEIPRLLEKLSEGYDVVYGTPMRQKHVFWRVFLSQLTKLSLQSAVGVKNFRNASAFRAFRTQVRDAFKDFKSPFVSIDVLLSWGTTRFTYIPVRHEPRNVGKSNYTFGKMVVHTLNMVTGFSTFPLQMATLLGYFFILFGAFVFAFIVGRYLILGHGVSGFTFLASVIAIFSGAQLFSIGIIGEYLARMHYRSMGRPSSIIRKSEGFPSSDKED